MLFGSILTNQVGIVVSTTNHHAISGKMMWSAVHARKIYIYSCLCIGQLSHLITQNTSTQSVIRAFDRIS